MNLFKYLKDKIKPSKINAPYPLIIFESDDWGTIRMPSTLVKEKLERENASWVADPYMQNDCIETDKDIEILFELLAKHKDADGKSCILTANCISQNPDFERIKENGFQKWVGQDFRQTFLNNYGSENAFALQRKGLEEGIFFPQFHGREHIHIFRWMKGLSDHDPLLTKAFNLNMISFKTKGSPPCISFCMDAFHPENIDMLQEMKQIINEGLSMFESAWGFKSSTLIAPCYFWHSSIEHELLPLGIHGFQGIRIQKESNLNNNPYSFRKKYHYPGEKNKSGQFYLVRNAYFEPSLDKSKDWVDSCLAEVNQSIDRYGFAIVSIHRLNFMGNLNIENRDRNIQLFDTLLKRLFIHFPSLRFASSVDMINYFSIEP